MDASTLQKLLNEVESIEAEFAEAGGNCSRLGNEYKLAQTKRDEIRELWLRAKDALKLFEEVAKRQHIK